MSVPTLNQAHAFLHPLKGRLSAFIVTSRAENRASASFILGCLAALRMRTLILDTSCFYGTNAEVLTERLPAEFLERTKVLTITDDAKLEEILAGVVTTKEAKAIIVDDLNTMNSLKSSGGEKFGVRKLFTLMRMFSWTARMNNLLVLATIYRNEGQEAKGSKRSLAAAADLNIIVKREASHITFRCDNVDIWSNHEFIVAADHTSSVIA